MKNKIKVLACISVVLLGTNAIAAANADKFTINVGGTSSSLDGTSSTGALIGLEISKDNMHNRQKQGYDLYIGASINTADDATITDVNFGGRYKVSPAFWIGGSLGVMGVSIDSTDETSFTGWSMGIHGKYEIAENQAMFMEYKNSTVSDSSGYFEFDVNTITIGYSYSFK